VTQVTLFTCALQGIAAPINPASHSFGKALFELPRSMRFPVSLLSILAVASIIGTGLKLAEP
jgi:cytochrome c biogenesis protein